MTADPRVFNFNHLYYFHVVATEGSLSRAAARLHVTEPTISAQIRSLEDSLNHRLFARTARGLRLTARGHYVAEHTAQMFRASHRMLQGLRPSETTPQSLAIGVSSSVTNSLATRAFVPLFAEGILVQVHHGDHDYLMRDLLTRDIDIVLGDRELAGKAARSLVASEIARPPFVAVASRRLARKVREFPKDLERLPFVLFPIRSRYRWETERYFSEQGIVPRIVGETEDIGIMRACAISHTCAVIVPRQQVQESLSRRELVELGAVDIESTVYAYTQRADVGDIVTHAIDTLRRAHLPRRLKIRQRSN